MPECGHNKHNPSGFYYLYRYHAMETLGKTVKKIKKIFKNQQGQILI